MRAAYALEILPLEQRIRQVKDGSPGHPEYTAAVLRDLAQPPLTAYFAGLPEQQAQLRMIVGDIEGWTYQQLAVRLQLLRLRAPKQAEQLLGLIVQPILNYEKRRNGVCSSASP